MIKLFIVTFMPFLMCTFLFGGDVKYDAKKFQNTPKMAKKLTKPQLKKVRKHNVTKVVIIECIGEFMVSREVEAGAMEKRYSATTTRSSSTMSLDPDYYELVVDRVYDLVKGMFEENGIEVVPKTVLIEDEDYKSLGLVSEKKGGGYTGGVTKKSVTTKTIKRSTTGMGMMSGFFASFKQTVRLASIIPKIVKKTDSNGTLKVNFNVDKGKKGTPVLSSFNIVMDSNLGETKISSTETAPHFKSSDVTIFSLKKRITSTVDVRGEEKGTVNMEAYDNALMEIITSVVDMYEYSLSKELGK